MRKISVSVVPGAKIEQIQEGIEGNLKIWVRGKPVDGQANKAVIKLLARHFHVPGSHIKIVSGLTARRKIIEISD